MSKVSDGAGLFGNANPFGQQSMNTGIDWNGIGSSIAPMSSMNNITPSWSPSGLNLGGVGSSISSGLDFLGQNKDAINAGAGLFGAYSNYQGMKNQQQYAQDMINMQKQQYALQEAERQRQIGKENIAQSGFSGGFENSGLFGYGRDKEEEQATSNYYNV